MSKDGNGDGEPEDGKPDGHATRRSARIGTPTVHRWLKEFRRTLGADYGEVVVKALLLGSRARGDWNPESGIDVMVIVIDNAAGEPGEHRGHGRPNRVLRAETGRPPCAR